MTQAYMPVRFYREHQAELGRALELPGEARARLVRLLLTVFDAALIVALLVALSS